MVALRKTLPPEAADRMVSCMSLALACGKALYAHGDMRAELKTVPTSVAGHHRAQRGYQSHQSGTMRRLSIASEVLRDNQSSLLPGQPTTRLQTHRPRKPAFEKVGAVEGFRWMFDLE